MKEQLDALVTELRRLRRDGVSRVAITESSLGELRKWVAEAKASAPTSSEPVSAPIPAVKSTPLSVPEPKPIPAAPIAIPVREEVVRETPPARAVAKAPSVPKAPPPPVVALAPGSVADRVEALRAWIQRDPLARERVAAGKEPVAFDGASDAPVLFLIHMPGADDNRDGRVLSGAEGELYGKIVGAMGLPRAKILTASLLPYRPEVAGGYDHREPTADEVAYYLPHFRALLAEVKPRAIVALGGGARDALLGKGEAISKSRGNWAEFDGIPVMPTYHISYLIRNNTNKSKRIVWEDMLSVMERLGLTISEKQRGYFL